MFNSIQHTNPRNSIGVFTVTPYVVLPPQELPGELTKDCGRRGPRAQDAPKLLWGQRVKHSA